MNKREAKTHALKIVGDSFLMYSERIDGTDYSDEEKAKILKEIDAICDSLNSRAIKLGSKKHTTK